MTRLRPPHPGSPTVVAGRGDGQGPLDSSQNSPRYSFFSAMRPSWQQSGGGPAESKTTDALASCSECSSDLITLTAQCDAKQSPPARTGDLELTRDTPRCVHRTGSTPRPPHRGTPARPWIRGHSPTEASALKCLYLVTRSSGPDRARQDTMDDPVEAGPQRVRDHLRRPLAGSRNLLMRTAGNTVAVTDPPNFRDVHRGAVSPGLL